MRALDLLRNGRLQETFPELSELVEPDPCADNVVTAAARMTIGDDAGALDAIAQFIELEPESVLSYIARGFAERGASGDFRLTPEGVSADSGDLFSGEAVGYWGRGVAKRALGDSKGALEDLEKTLELNNDVVLTARCRRDVATLCQGDEG